MRRRKGKTKKMAAEGQGGQRTYVAWLVVLAVVVAAYMISHFVERRSAPVEERLRRYGEAYEVAKKHVERELESPASAEWPQVYDTVSESVVEESKARRIKMTGHVDSDNEYGARIRSYYEVALDERPSGELVVQRFKWK